MRYSAGYIHYKITPKITFLTLYVKHIPLDQDQV